MVTKGLKEIRYRHRKLESFPILKCNIFCSDSNAYNEEGCRVSRHIECNVFITSKGLHAVALRIQNTFITDLGKEAYHLSSSAANKETN